MWDAEEEQPGSHRGSDGMFKEEPKVWKKRGLGDLGRNNRRKIEGYGDKKG